MAESIPMTADPLIADVSADLAAPLPTQEETAAGVARATGVLALGNITSRVLGLAREIVLTNLFGASAAVSVFDVATLVPRALYDLLIGGHVNGAIVPVLSEIITLKGRDELWRVVSILLTLMTVLMAGLVILLQWSAPAIVHLVASGLSPYSQAMAVDLLRLTSPALIFMTLFAVLSGTLYALRSFTWPAFATSVFNATIVLVLLVFAPPPQVRAAWDGTLLHWTIARPMDGIWIAGVGWLVGAVAYFLLQLPGLRGARLRFSLDWRHPAIRQIGVLYLPVMFSLVMDTLIIRPFSYNLASQTGENSIAYMNRATTLIQFPQGLVATAISIAILPTLARQAALVNGHREDTAFKDTLGLGMRLATTLILPATVGLFLMATPIVALIFEHGAFTPADTEITSLALRLYLFGLPFAALDLLLVYAFYARQDTLTPALVGLFSLTVYMVTALLLLGHFGLFSLMIADSVKHVVHALTSALLLHRRLRGLVGQRLVGTFVKTGLATLAMGAVMSAVLPLLLAITGGRGLLQETALVVCAGALGTVVFLALALVLHIEEWRWLSAVIRRKLG